MLRLIFPKPPYSALIRDLGSAHRHLIDAKRQEIARRMVDAVRVARDGFHDGGIGGRHQSLLKLLKAYKAKRQRGTKGGRQPTDAVVLVPSTLESWLYCLLAISSSTSAMDVVSVDTEAAAKFVADNLGRTAADHMQADLAMAGLKLSATSSARAPTRTNRILDPEQQPA